MLKRRVAVVHLSVSDVGDNTIRIPPYFTIFSPLIFVVLNGQWSASYKMTKGMGSAPWFFIVIKFGLLVDRIDLRAQLLSG